MTKRYTNQERDRPVKKVVGQGMTDYEYGQLEMCLTSGVTSYKYGQLDVWPSRKWVPKSVIILIGLEYG